MKYSVILSILLFGCISINAQDDKYAEVHGLKIHYQISGQGEPLLMLHGFTETLEAWATWIEDLSKQYQLILPDLRGHGKSTNPSGLFTHKMSAIDMYGLMDHLQIEHFKAIGHSSGAMTLLHMATMDTDRISAMVLVAGTSYFPDQSRSIMQSVSYDDWKADLEKRQPQGEKQIKMLVSQFRNFAYSYEDMNFTPPYLATIKCPTLIIHGDRDSFFPVDIPVEIYKSIPNSYLWILPGSRHFPAGIDDRNSIWGDVFIKVLENFLGGNWN